MNVISSIATFYKEGGMYMHAVLVIAVVVAAIIVERLIVIGRATSLNGRKFTDDLVRFASRGDLMGARNVSTQSNAPVARVAQAMLHTAGHDEASFQSAADDAAVLVIPDLAKRLPALNVFANSATLIGLLGTITGLITAISGVGVADAAQRSAYLASGISEALHTTAFGLIIAIPTLLIQGWLNSRVENIAQDCDEMSIRLGRALAHAGAGPAHIAAVPRTPHVSGLPGSRLPEGGR